MNRTSLFSIGLLCLTLPLATLAAIKPQIAQSLTASKHKHLPAITKAKSLKLNAKAPITAQPAQLVGINGATATPILTSGDILPQNGYQMAGIPDGLGIYKSSGNQFTLLMNHELTTGFTPPNISDSRVSRLVIDKRNLQIKQASYLINGSEGYRRFCSASFASLQHWFNIPMFLTNEEATDGVRGGISVAVNPFSGNRTDMPWLGHLSHENTTPVPGYGKVVLITDDDNGTSTGPFNHLYMYIANSESDLLVGNGQLYTFVADNGKNSPADFPDKQTTLSGHFVPIDQADNTNATALRTKADALGAMIFVRPEDITTKVGAENTLFFTTTGRSSYVNPATSQPYDARGRVYMMKLDKTDPTKVNALSVILNGDLGDDILNPDNLATSKNSLMIQEDINSEFEDIHVGRVLQYKFRDKSLTPVAEVVQTSGKLGQWESSGIINASSVLGRDAWLLDVQSHTLFTDYNGKQDESGQLLFLKVPGS